MTDAINGKCWSCSVGDRGRNRVRAFERASDGHLFLEWYEPAPGRTRPAVKRIALPSRDRDKAKAAAERLVVELRAAIPPARARLNLETLFDNYVREVSPHKGESKRRHDERAARLFLDCFGRNREVHTLSIRDWNRFIQLRRSGTLRPKGRGMKRKALESKGTTKSIRPRPVRERVICYDLQFLRAALRWATLAGDGRGGTLLERNPLQGLPLPD